MLLDYARTVLALKMNALKLDAFKLGRLRIDRRAVTAMEYGLIAALVAVVIIVAVSTVGTNLKNTFNSVGSEL
jgi:pilus assembly protein Flp/PilA